jgi:serine/threonine protein phosphatase 1
MPHARTLDFRPAPGRLPPDTRIYAVGDVHGYDALLADIHAQIAADLAARPVAQATLVHLGDYVDRGPDSAAVIARVGGPPPSAGLSVVNLMGNHEAMLRAALAGDVDGTIDWVRNGGLDTLQSWGGRDLDEIDAIPAEARATLSGLALTHRAGDYLFVHAGLRPGIALERQDRHDLLWIREPFLSWDGPLPAIVVHGHTPRPAPVVRANRIGIDTGAGSGPAAGGYLTAVVLENDAAAFLHSGRP